MKRLLQIIILAGLFLSACAQPTPEPAPTSSPTNTPVPTFTLTPTLTLTPTFTFTPFPTITSSPTMTYTPLPLLRGEEMFTTITDLIKNNGGCRLPCWWGITPGETSWGEAKHFLASFVYEIVEDEFTIEEGGKEVVIEYKCIQFFVPGEGRREYTVFHVRDGIVIKIFAGLLYKYREFYPIYKILQEYGEPNEIWVHAHPTPTGEWTMSVSLIYQGRSFSASYWNSNGFDKGNNIYGCFGKEGASLRLFPSEKVLEFGDVINLSPYAHIGVHDIKTATGMDVTTFYETYQDATNPVCIETPAEIWYP